MTRDIGLVGLIRRTALLVDSYDKPLILRTFSDLDPHGTKTLGTSTKIKITLKDLSISTFYIEPGYYQAQSIQSINT